MMWRKIIPLFLCLLISLTAWSEPNERPLKEIVTYQEFTDLLKFNVNKIPDLQELWQWQRRTKKHIYFGGGVLRGLMHWTYKQLQNHTIEEVKKMRVPSIAELQLQKGSDIDLFAPDNVVDQIKREVPKYKTWDILADSFHEGNVKLGGPTIEKARINPNYFDDPLGGIKDYYNGILRYHWTPEKEFRKLYWVKKRGNTKTTEALRLLRFSYNMPELKIDDESLENIKKIADIETKLIKKSKENNWWLEKSLKKLHYATHENVNETLAALKRGNLLSIMAHHKYMIPGDSRFSIDPDTLAQKGFSVEEMKYAEKITLDKINSIISFMNKASAHVKNAKEFEILTMPNTSTPNEKYLEALKKWKNDHHEILFKNNPNMNQMLALIRECNSVNSCIEMRSAAIPNIKTSSDYLKIADINHSNPSEAYKKALSNWKFENLDAFFEKNPTMEETLAYIKDCSTIQNCIDFRNKALLRVKTTDDFLALANMEKPSPSGAYKIALDQWKINNAQTFFQTQPKQSHFKRLKKTIMTTNTEKILDRIAQKNPKLENDCMGLFGAFIR